MAVDPALIWTMATNLLDDIRDVFADAGEDLPARIFVAEPGLVSLDCDQLAVAATRIFPGQPGAEQGTPFEAGCMWSASIEFSIWLALCVSVPQESGQPPSEIAIEEAAERVFRAGWTLFDGLRERIIAKQMLAFEACDEVVLGPLTAHGPEGGIGGWSLTIQAGIF